jgi:hypothetical protein
MIFGRPPSLWNPSTELIHKAEEQAKKGHITKITKKVFFTSSSSIAIFRKRREKNGFYLLHFFVLQIYAFPYLCFHLEKIEIIFVNCNYKNGLEYLESI